MASLRRTTLDWAVKALNTLRLATVIVYMEFMADLLAEGLPADPTIRLESWLIHLFHNLSLVGFFCVSYRMIQTTFTIDLVDLQRRPVRDAIIHASQVLDQLSAAVRSDPAVRPSPERVSVRLVGEEARVHAEASVDVSNAIARSEGRLTMKKYVACVDFWIERK